MKKYRRLIPAASIALALLWLILASCTTSGPVSVVVQPSQPAQADLLQTAQVNTATAQALAAAATEQIRQTVDALAVTQTRQALQIQLEQIERDAEAARVGEARANVFNIGMGIIFFMVAALFVLLMAWLIYQTLRSHVNFPGRSGQPVRTQVMQAAFYPEEAPGQAVPPTAFPPFNGLDPNIYTADIPAIAPWRYVVEEWRAGSTLPLGAGANGLIEVNLARSPHLLIAGSRQSQLELFALRPLSAAALASGWLVEIYTEDENLFRIFEQRPNFNLKTYGLNRIAQATLALRRLVDEARNRAESAGFSRQRQLVIFHHLLGGGESLRWRDQQNELWQVADDAAALGGPAGIHLVFTLFDPGYYALHPRLRSHLAPVAFQVSSVAASRVVLNRDGAERLYPRQFTANLNGGSVYGFAFAPDDKEIERYLDDAARYR